MKNSRALLISVFLLIVFTSSTLCSNLSEQQSQRIKTQIESLFEESVEQAEKLDFEAISQGVDDRHKCGYFTNRTYYPDYAALMAASEEQSRGVESQQITILKKQITVLSEQSVLLTAIGKAESSLPDGRLLSFRFHWTLVYEKIDGAWKIIHTHQSPAR